MPFIDDLQRPAEAIAQFPRGLVQPPDSFRFSADALLLAAFARPQEKEKHLLDLGCGCGVVAFAALLDAPGRTAIGVDIDQALLDACTANAMRLGLGQQVTTIAADISSAEERRRIPHGSFDLAYANPPYYLPERGRLAQQARRAAARFDTGQLLLHFLLGAYRGLKSKGRLALVFPAARLADLLLALRNARLEPRRLRPVHSKAQHAAHLVLVEAKKDAKPDLVLEAPLILHEGNGASTRLTEAARAFCPYLACNDGVSA